MSGNTHVKLFLDMIWIGWKKEEKKRKVISLFFIFHFNEIVQVEGNTYKKEIIGSTIAKRGGKIGFHNSLVVGNEIGEVLQFHSKFGGKCHHLSEVTEEIGV